MSFKSRTAEARLRTFPPDGAVVDPMTPGSVDSAVLATSRFVELMELAALRLMKGRMRDGEVSVAVEMRVTHAVPVVSGRLLRAVAHEAGIHGRLHRFTVHVFDESGLVASAEHARAVARPRGLLGMARRRAGRGSMPLDF